jgi:hypothetical protein
VPIYTYQIIHADGSEGDIFEASHGMNEPPLTRHPETGEKVVRVFQAPHVAGWSHERQSKQMLGDKNIERLGFTKYVRNGKGQYEKRTGQGPGNISAD